MRPATDAPLRPAAGSHGNAERRPSPLQRSAPRFAAWATFLVGLIDLVSSLSRADSQRLRVLTQHVPGALTAASAAGTLSAGVLLVLLARGLRRRKRRALVAVVVLLAASAVLHVLKGLDVEEAGLSVLLVVWLVHSRGEFYAAGDPRTRWRALGVGLLLTAGSAVLGVLLVAFRRGELVHGFQFGPVLRGVLLGLIGIDGPLHWTTDTDGLRAADLVGDGLLGLGVLTVAVTTFLLLRPAEPIGRLSAQDEARMRVLLDRQGERDSLGYFALRREKSVLWSPSGKACIAYRVVSGVLLASGDPLGDPEAWPGAISGFLALAEAHAWAPAVMGCSETGAAAWSRAGLDALEIGDEAVVDAATFCLAGREMRNVRQAVARVERAGYTCAVRRVRDIPPADRRELQAQAAAWRGADTERGFSMALGRMGDPADDACVIVTASQDGQLRAFLHFVPWGSDGLSLDLMRRDRAADNGLNEYLIARTLQAGMTLGVQRLSLNFAVFRSALERGEKLGAGPVLRGWRRCLVFLSRWFQIESLYRFNAKFRPEWQPRFLCYRGAGELPRVALAVMEAEAFLTWPRPPWRRESALPLLTHPDAAIPG